VTHPTWEIRVGGALDQLRTMPDESVHCVVTSPPYWGLRDYGTGTWEGGDADCDHVARLARNDVSGSALEPGAVFACPTTGEGSKVSPIYFRGLCEKCGAVRSDGQIGTESTPEEYVAGLVEIFREVRRVLRSDGTLWLNMGDCYATGAGRVGDRAGGGTQGDHWQGLSTQPNRMPIPGLKPKDLVGAPWRLAFALQADGWFLRSDIIWAKPNPNPESVLDRPTSAHEYVFLLSKARRYFYDAEAVAEPSIESAAGNSSRHIADGSRGRSDHLGSSVPWKGSTRNRRSVWTITTKPFKEAHFATFPPELPEICIRAGTSEVGCCPECGAPWSRVVDRTRMLDGEPAADPPSRGELNRWRDKTNGAQPGNWRYGVASRTIAWQISCDHSAPPVPTVVLDPFAGAFTTGLVALRLGRSAVGVELSAAFADMGEARMRGDLGVMNHRLPL